MDPNATLKQLREGCRALSALLDGEALITPMMREEIDIQADRVAVLFDALDSWLSKDGFPPDDWALHKSETQWRVFCSDCAEVIECSEEMGRAVIHAHGTIKSQHRYFLERRVHAYSAWERVDAS